MARNGPLPAKAFMLAPSGTSQTRPAHRMVL